MKVDIHPSSQSFPMYMKAHDFRQGCVWAVVYLLVNNRLVFSSDLWVACTRLLPGSMTCGPCLIAILLLHEVLNLIYFVVSPMSSIP